MNLKTRQLLCVAVCFLVLGSELGDARVLSKLVRSQDGSLDSGIDAISEVGRKKKRSVAVAAQVLFGVAFAVSLGNVGFNLYLQYGDGCCEIYDSICDDEDRFNEYRRKLQEVSDEIDETYLAADTLFEYAQQCNYHIKDLWTEINRIATLNDQIVDGIPANVVAELEQISSDIETELEAKNETVMAYTNADLNLRYQTVWDNTNTALQTGFYLASYPLSVIGAQVVKFYIQRSINKFAAELSAKYGTILQNSLTGSGKAASFFGVKSTADIDGHVQQTANAVTKAKYSKTVTWGTRILEGVSIVTSLATIGMEAWALAETIQNCEKLKGDVKDAANQIEEAYDDNVDLKDVVEEFKVNITNYWDEDIRAEITSEDMDLVLDEIRNMTLNAANSERMASATQAIDDWFAGIYDADEQGTYDLLGGLTKALSNVSYTLECYRNKVRAIKYISEQCAKGDDHLHNIYDDANENFYFNDDDCIDNAGYAYTTYEETQESIERLSEDEGYHADCILNSEIMKDKVCDLHWNGNTTEEIGAELDLTNDQVTHFSDTCGPSPTQEALCNLKEKNDTLGVFTVEDFAFILSISEQAVIEGLEECDAEEEITTEATTTEATTTEATTTTEEPTTEEVTTEATTTEATTTEATTAPPIVSNSSSRRRRRRRRRRIWGKKK